ncbi:uncharacterized protein LOC129730677 [Wyeomyia smithii]|uniref:uncharacterized protein LOC129730677 n=1 Tax=Wyeomyia smithii TaxID=174621 RepID=UPI002467DF20|nr:uncharacterized protein LOC129730677 [Wyeomyia smithii]XP_055546179.1 uncharacterized protein LOC129730677 [Wyeomyia smithii]
MGYLIIWLVAICLSGFMACTAHGIAVEMRAEIISDSASRSKRTIGSGSDFVNCLAIGETTTQHRFCSYDQSLLSAIVRTFTRSDTEQQKVRPMCPAGQVFRNRCNVCECKAGGSLLCSTDLCAEDFFDANGLPKYW